MVLPFQVRETQQANDPSAPEACLPALLRLGFLKQDDSIENIFCHAVQALIVEMGVKELSLPAVALVT